MQRDFTARDHRGWRFRHGAAPLLAAVLVVVTSGAVLGHAEHGHPARIHEGTCDDLGPVAFSLNGVGGSVDLDNAPLATPVAVNPETSYQVVVSETVVTAPLEEMLAGDHAVMVYESDEAMEAIACGNLGGAMTGDTLITALAAVGTQGHVGFALFSPDGEETIVSLIVGHALAASAEHAPEEEAADHEHEAGEEESHAEATPAA